MAPKKKSGFMTYVMEFRKKKGQRMSVPQAVTHCGEIWKNMTDQQRGPYIASAKNTNFAASAKRDLLNCHGSSISAVQRKERQAADDVARMKRDIESIVQKGKNRRDLENTKFMFASFSYFVKGLNTDIYIPAEFSACEFTLNGGVNSLYSTMINPGHLIFGQACDAMLHRDATHQLPLPPNAFGEPNMRKLYQSIQEYLRRRLDQEEGNDLKSLVVFTSTEQMPVVKACFHFLEIEWEHENDYINANDDADNAGESSNFLPIVVYDIQYLFLVLKKAVMEIGGVSAEKPNIFITNAFFLRDFFEYQDGIACQYHEEKDRSKHCTQSMVKRWAYTFSDYMCGDLAITMQPGRHMPPSYEIKYTITELKSDSFFSLPTADASALAQKDHAGEECSSDSTLSPASSFTTLQMNSLLKSFRTGKNADVRHTMDEFADDEFKMTTDNRHNMNRNWIISQPKYDSDSEA